MQFNIQVILSALLLASLSGINGERIIAQFKENNSRLATSNLDHIRALEQKIQEANGNSRSGVQSTILHKFNTVFKGYAGDFTEEIQQWIKQQPEIAAVQKDNIFEVNALQSDAPWGLTRISQRGRVEEKDKGNYHYLSETGQNVNVYVLDTGINIEHIDFEGRARWGKTFAPGASDKDLHGHGTHVAGTIAGRQYGVSKGARVIAAKVLGDNGSGYTADIIAALDWVVEDKPLYGGKLKGKVVNMSLGGGKDLFLNQAVDRTVDAGVVVVVSAGNNAYESCRNSPASAAKAITVGATTVDDTLASFSNFGSCVDILAPGRFVLSAWIGSNKATNNISGTSMASPHVAGVAADYLSKTSFAETLSPSALTQKLLDLSTKNAISNLPKDTVNLLAFNNPPKYN